MNNIIYVLEQVEAIHYTLSERHFNDDILNDISFIVYIAIVYIANLLLEVHTDAAGTATAHRQPIFSHNKYV
jgi:hypothetical protein